MAHDAQLTFVAATKEFLPEYFSRKRVLEVGSRGFSGVRNFFVDCDYIGLDVSPGSNVDIVCRGHDYFETTESFDVVVACECFEHDQFWLETFINMIRLCKCGGLIVFTCATTARGEHGTFRSAPESSGSTSVGWDYYRNLTRGDFTRSIDMDKHFEFYGFFNNYHTQDLYFYGIKAKQPIVTDPDGIKAFKHSYVDGVLVDDFEARIVNLSRRAEALVSPFAASFTVISKTMLKYIIRYCCITDKRFQDVLFFSRKIATRVLCF